MTGLFRGADGVEKLLKVAQADAEAVRTDLLDIGRAKGSARTALAEIAESVAQEVGGAGDPVAFAAYAEGMRERRVNLKKTLSALENAEADAQEKLSNMLGEIAKLERLTEINARDALGKKHSSGAGGDSVAVPRRAAAT